MTSSQDTKGHSIWVSGGLTTGQAGTHGGVVEAIAVRKPWFGGQAGAGKRAEQTGLQLEGFAAATTSRGWGVRQGTLSWAAASPSASPAPGLLTRQVAGWEQAV